MSEDRDDEIVEAEILHDVREGYGRPRSTDDVLSSQRHRLQHGKLYEVRISSLVRVRARTPQEAEDVASLLNAGREVQVHEVYEVDEAAVRAEQFERGAGGE